MWFVLTLFQCRSRHVKCDERRPTCSMCADFGLPCAGYKKHIFFDSRNPDSKIRFRRPLLTETERERISQSLVSMAPPKSTPQLLSQIDEEGENASGSQSAQLTLGPFGVFKLHEPSSPQLPTACDLNLVPDVPENCCNSSPPVEVAPMVEPYPVDPSLSQWSPGLIQSLLEPLDADRSSTSAASQDLIIDPGHMEAMPPWHVPYQLSCCLSDSYCRFPLSSTAFDSAPSTTLTPPQDAVFLLKHYSSTVINLMTPVRHKKTPWHILFIPHAKDCLAALALGEELSNARLCAFYAALAISAFSISGASRSEAWFEQAQTYLRLAQNHVKLMLMSAYDIPKPAKYKSILMAILSMVQLSTLSGDRDEAEGYFLEAEKFIRIKGLKRKKSRKVRLLHHCYVFERLFHESVFVGRANSNHRQNVRLAIESSGLARASVDGLSFRLYKWSNLRQEMLRVRDQEEGENDLHLERPGHFSATLYPEIFGIPEPWLFLLSLVIRLAAEKDDAEQDDRANNLNARDFTSRAKALEDCIIHLQYPGQSAAAFSSHLSCTEQHLLGNMLEALRNALAIYFYRRIYDLNASMLQEKVGKVLSCLLQCEYADSSAVHGSASFIWPAFIAACEAEDPRVQESFSTWFATTAGRSGVSCFTRTLASIEKIWQEKRSCNGIGATWVDLIAQPLPQQV